MRIRTYTNVEIWKTDNLSFKFSSKTDKKVCFLVRNAGHNTTY